MIYDCRNGIMPPVASRVFVDGVEIPEVWYSDDVAGVVKTYWVSDDREPHAAWDKVPFYRDAVSDGELMSRTIYGKVELRPL